MQVFISYAREDADAARRLYDSLRQYPDLSPWLDRKNLVAGASWENSIKEAISGSDIVVLLISATSISKVTFIQREIEIIIERLVEQDSQILLLPARLDHSVPRWPEIARLHMVDLHSDWTDGIDQLMKAIRSRTGQLEDRLKDAYPDRSKKKMYRRALMLVSGEDEIRRWSSAFEDVLCTLPAPVVFRHLASIHPVYMDEIMDLALALSLIRRRRPEAIPSYVFRIHEVAKSVTEPHEFPEAYGVALSGGRLLEAPIRTMFIRDMYTSFKGIARHHLFGLSTWPQEWTFCELAKHLMAREDARYESNADIAEDVLQLVRNDVPALDTLVFAGRLSGDCRFLIRLFDSLRRSAKVSLPSPPKEFQPHLDVKELSSLDLDRLDGLERAGAELADRCRLGALCRIGEYLTRGQSRELSAFGADVMVAALKAMDDDESHVTDDVLSLSAHERLLLFDALETYREDAANSLVGEAAAARLKAYWTDYFYTYRYEDGWDVAPVALEAPAMSS